VINRIAGGLLAQAAAAAAQPCDRSPLDLCIEEIFHKRPSLAVWFAFMNGDGIELDTKEVGDHAI